MENTDKIRVPSGHPYFRSFRRIERLTCIRSFDLRLLPSSLKDEREVFFRENQMIIQDLSY